MRPALIGNLLLVNGAIVAHTHLLHRHFLLNRSDAWNERLHDALLLFFDDLIDVSDVVRRLVLLDNLRCRDHFDFLLIGP